VILERLMKHLREQNWTAVAIEFVIVVVGVVIGFQVTDWKEIRVQATQRAASLERLHDEAENAVAYFRRFGGFRQHNSLVRSEAIQRLIDNDWEGADLDELTFGLGSVGILPAISPPRSVYDEVINAGMFANLGSASLRDAISAYYSKLAFVQGQVEYMRSLQGDHSLDWRHPAVHAEFAPDTNRQTRYRLDFGVLSQDPEFIERAIVANNAARAMDDWWGDTLENAEAMCQAIALETRRPCSPPEEYDRAHGTAENTGGVQTTK